MQRTQHQPVAGADHAGAVTTGPAPITGPVVLVGLQQIYDQLVGLNTKVEILINNQRDVEARQQDHETRLRALERSRWPLPALAVLVSAATFIVNAFRPW